MCVSDNMSALHSFICLTGLITALPIAPRATPFRQQVRSFIMHQSKLIPPWRLWKEGAQSGYFSNSFMLILCHCFTVFKLPGKRTPSLSLYHYPLSSAETKSGMCQGRDLSKPTIQYFYFLLVRHRALIQLF